MENIGCVGFSSWNVEKIGGIGFSSWNVFHEVPGRSSRKVYPFTSLGSFMGSLNVFKIEAFSREVGEPLLHPCPSNREKKFQELRVRHLKFPVSTFLASKIAKKNLKNGVG